MTKEKFKAWAVGFSATALRIITIAWIIFMLYSAVLMGISLFKTGNLETLGLFITEVNKTFIASVVTILITRVVGNLFEFNNGGIFGYSRGSENDSTDSGISADDNSDIDSFNDGGN